MGSGKQKKSMERQGVAQERISETQERLGGKFIEQGDEDRAREQELFEMIRPYAEKLMGLGDPSKYGDLERPDVTGTIRRDYSDELADITQSKNRALADAEGFYTSSGLSKRQYGCRPGQHFSGGSERSRIGPPPHAGPPD